MFGSILGMMGSLMGGMGGGGAPMIDNSAAQWQAAQLDASTQMATNAATNTQQAAAGATQSNLESNQMNQQALANIIDTFRGALLKGYGGGQGMQF